MRLILIFAFAVSALAQTVVLQTGTILDGRGGVLRGQQITIENGRIVKIAPGTAKIAIDI